MTQFLPSNLLALFAARDPIVYLPPVERLSHEKRTTGYTGISDYLHYFETGPPPPKEKYETKDERQDRRRREKEEQVTYKLEQEIAMWDPAANEKASLDPFKTVFVGRVNFDTTESKLKRVFEAHGPVKKIVIVKDKKTAKPRGYAFVEYEHERDMHSAYKHADGKKVDEKRILVDVERGRTVKGWLPRRLGGGLGGTRRGGPDVNIKISGREDPDRERFRDGNDREKRDDRRVDRRDRDKSRDRNGSVDRDRDRSARRERRRSHERIPRNPDRLDRGDRDRERGDKDKDRKRRRSRSRDRNPEEEEERSRKRSRSPREKKRHRDGSRDKKERKKEKKDKDRDRERDRDRGDRKERKVKSEKVPKEEDDDDLTQVRIKQEPVDDYPAYDGVDYNNHENYVKQEL